MSHFQELNEECSHRKNVGSLSLSTLLFIANGQGEISIGPERQVFKTSFKMDVVSYN